MTFLIKKPFKDEEHKNRYYLYVSKFRNGISSLWNESAAALYLLSAVDKDFIRFIGSNIDFHEAIKYAQAKASTSQIRMVQAAANMWNDSYPADISKTLNLLDDENYDVVIHAIAIKFQR